MEDEAPGKAFYNGFLRFCSPLAFHIFLFPSSALTHYIFLPVFHAKPVSKRMMEAPVGVPPKKAAVLIGKETTHFDPFL